MPEPIAYLKGFDSVVTNQLHVDAVLIGYLLTFSNLLFSTCKFNVMSQTPLTYQSNILGTRESLQDWVIGLCGRRLEESSNAI